MHSAHETSEGGRQHTRKTAETDQLSPFQGPDGVVSTSEEVAVNLIVTDAADADAGTSAPLSWEFWYSVRRGQFW